MTKVNIKLNFTYSLDTVIDAVDNWEELITEKYIDEVKADLEREIDSLFCDDDSGVISNWNMVTELAE